eukprot:TRINITY_DN37517_c0_g1_i1.p1 TRINITY_DN37517_c0_g1~~TRINITY_DN37517_c0_g1_i1.p1  ORF type:complete len:320 (-),score=110.56 TRINITY_DN37517_c0_g1_i1:189-1103(-)
MEAESDEAATQAGVEAAEEEKDEEAEEEDADGDDDGEEADAEDNGDDKPHESRKSLKRKLRAEQRAEWKAAQKVKQKQKRKGKRHKGPPLPPRTEAETQSGEHQKPSAEEVRTSRAARKAAELEDFRQRSALGTTVVLDLEWEQAMQEKELKSLLQQVLYCYGANRRASRPTRLVFSGVEPGSQTHAGLSKQAGYESWEVQKLSGAYVEAFPKERLVYLTADSEEVLESFDPEKVYIIGGIVDRNRLKGRTMEKALEQGIATAQLPLARHIVGFWQWRLARCVRALCARTKEDARPGRGRVCSR